MWIIIAVVSTIVNAVQFKSVFTPPDDTPLPEAPEYSIEEPLQKITVGASDVESSLKLLNPNKSIDPDKLDSQILKKTHAEIALPLTNMFKKSLDAE
ncbi:hypothetical protein QYM36_017805 [Artemia franciscana]|uniref:Uncharacterized protein n=1 Tax=Artemia franciscana TaxID=6661 RepID=A0AA88H5U0_ARTSF|nr:hypothetical protein QYM36_017805 [Artemia franciscana]